MRSLASVFDTNPTKNALETSGDFTNFILIVLCDAAPGNTPPQRAVRMPVGSYPLRTAGIAIKAEKRVPRMEHLGLFRQTISA
jgi:hypothetical protein